jgi:hypothetical protein
MNYDRENGKRLLKRARNVVYEPAPADVWLYHDVEGEGVVSWRINSVEGRTVRMVKLDGKDPGYTTSYQTAGLAGHRWFPKKTHGEVVYLWPCPSCNEDHPVMQDDYVCVECRKEVLDNDS